MITARNQKNLENAIRYFDEHLSLNDYYSEGQKVRGEWFGKGAERLGMEAGQVVSAIGYSRLCLNQHPLTGTQLTVRQRNVDRRIYTDFQVAPPKSVSIMALVAGDNRILAAHDACAKEAMIEMEKLAATRVRKDGSKSERTTGEIAAAVFRHDASRALDCQVHTHYIVFNATYDPVEARWKALESRHMFDATRYGTAVYRAALGRRLEELGYRLRPTADAFEIDGVSPDLIHRFSKRRQAILEEEARIENALGVELTNNGRAAVAHASRDRKVKNLSTSELLRIHQEQLSEAEWEGLRSLVPVSRPAEEATPAVRTAAPTEPVDTPTSSDDGDSTVSDAPAPSPARLEEPVTAYRVSTTESQESVRNTNRPTESTNKVPRYPEKVKAAIDFARDHVFERVSVADHREILQVALHHGRGWVTLAEAEQELGRRLEFLREGDRIATKAGLEEERRVIQFVNAGIGRCQPLRRYPFDAQGLDSEQREALGRLLDSPDQVSALRGVAGSGKTVVLRALADALARDHEVQFIAPTRAGVKALGDAGLPGAKSVSEFLTKPAGDERRMVLVVDEAGLLSNRQLLQLAERATAGRLVLSGDSRQHHSVEAGDALRMLENHSALQTVSLKTVRRQTSEEYRLAIADFAKGAADRALARLDRMGAIEVVEDSARTAVLAMDYVASVLGGKTAVTVCPTWGEADAVTEDIRALLKADGLLTGKEQVVTAHRSMKWTRAQKRDFSGYQEGMVLTFHLRTRDFRQGETGKVIRVKPNRLIVTHPRCGQVAVTLRQTGCFDVVKERKIGLMPGERILIQGNRRANGLRNGQIKTVKKVRASGDIELEGGQVIPADFRLFTHGYAITSQSAQGPSVDHVYLSISENSQYFASEKHLYVGASRGRERVKIYTAHRETLFAIAQRPGTRVSATEMIENARRHKVAETKPSIGLKA